MFALGAFMMWQGISAEGAIDIRSSILSGSVKSGSAGLFIAFLSFVVIVFVLTSTNHNRSYVPAVNLTKTKRIGRGLAALLAGCIVAGTLGALGFGNGFAMLAVFLGFSFLMGGIIYISILADE